MNKIKILSWNVNGIRAVHRKNFMEWFNEEKPDILCVQETKAQDDQIPEEIASAPGYELYVSSAERKGYSGVAVLSNKKAVRFNKGFGIEKFDNEGRILELDFGGFSLLNVYFPNGVSSKERLQYKMDFYEAFLKHLKKLLKQDKRIVICGDVNTAHKEIDLARPKPNEKVSGFLPEEREWIDKLLKTGFIDTLRVFNQKPEQYTWWDMMTRARDRNVGWRIDYFFISDNLKDNLKNAFILPDVMGSDHCPVGIELKF